MSGGKTIKYNLSQNPIFIIGCPRSGTTLLQVILATQDGLVSLPETHFFSIISRKITYNSSGYISSSCLKEVQQSIREMTKIEFPDTTRQNLYLSAKQNQLNQKNLFELIIYTFLKQQFPDQDISKLRWIEKTPHHFMHFEKILTLYPDAKFVGIIRSPVPTVYSRKKKIPTDKNVSYGKLSQDWNLMFRSYEKLKQESSNKIYLLKYENLVNDLKNQMELLCDFLDINLDQRLLKNYKHKSNTFILPNEKWKSDVKSDEIRNTNDYAFKNIKIKDILKIQRVTRFNMQKYGYEILYQPFQNIYNFFSLLFQYPFSFLKKILSLMKNRK